MNKKPLLHWLRAFFRSRPHLTLAFLFGPVTGACLPANWSVLTRLMIGWNAAVWPYLFMMGWLMMRASHTKVRQIAERQDNTGPAVLAILLVASLFSISAVLFGLVQVRTLPLHERLLHYWITGATVLGSWCLVGTLFTVHYAHMHYRAHAEARPLIFPGNETNPTYWDFLYFSFTIAVAVQTSDVTVATRTMRKLVLAQSVLSFFFNAAILGLSINVAASLVGS